MSVFAQNNGVIALTRCANRTAGYCACFWLIIMGILAKFAAALVGEFTQTSKPFACQVLI